MQYTVIATLKPEVVAAVPESALPLWATDPRWPGALRATCTGVARADTKVLRSRLRCLKRSASLSRTALPVVSRAAALAWRRMPRRRDLTRGGARDLARRRPTEQ